MAIEVDCLKVVCVVRVQVSVEPSLGGARVGGRLHYTGFIIGEV